MEFLLKFARDRRRWLQWLFEAKKRYGLRVLNDMVTLSHSRDGKWTESVSVGSEPFVEATKEKLGYKAKGRKVVGESGTASYNGIIAYENAVVKPQNEFFWKKPYVYQSDGLVPPAASTFQGKDLGTG